MRKLWRLLELAARALVVVLPWPLKRWCLRRWLGYELHPTARIGWSWVYPRHLVMAAGSSIGDGNVVIHLERLEMGEAATLARGNWITGYPKDGERHFQHRKERRPELVLGEHAAITKNHHLDCTDAIHIGRFTTVAGYASQFLTHSIDLAANRQDCQPIRIGEYCFVGTDCTVLGGAALPDRSVLGAKALLSQAFVLPGRLYAGVPAREVARVDEQAGYFVRETGFVE